MHLPDVIPLRTVGEWRLGSRVPYNNRFADVVISGKFTSPTGQIYTIPGFYDGGSEWAVRFNPGEIGLWSYQITAQPMNADLTHQGHFEVIAAPTRGYLKATPGQAWGFHYESGEPSFILGDTTYELFGMAFNQLDVFAFMDRRAKQGFNLLRARMSSSPFINVANLPVLPEDFVFWHSRSTWPWGGCEQSPQFDVFNLPYFHMVDRVVQHAESLGLGLELIMEAWGNEFPFNNRQVFVPEWEEFWLRYLIARYDAYNCVYFWTLMNEYEYYPDGDWRYHPLNDRWAMRLARWVKHVAPHQHIVAVHNGPREPAFESRFVQDPDAVDAIMFQDWGARDEKNAWLAAGLEDQIGRSLKDWHGSAILSEYGYERNEDMPMIAPLHRYCDPEHTRRGAWRGAFCGLGIVHGFDNSWAPFALLDQDQAGLPFLLHLRNFFTEIVPFFDLQPTSDIVPAGEYQFGYRPLAMTSADKKIIVIYLPAGGAITPILPAQTYQAEWFDPRTGTCHTASVPPHHSPLNFVAPQEESDRPFDWVLVLRAEQAEG